MYPPELEPNIGTEYGYDSEISIKLVWDQMNKKMHTIHFQIHEKKEGLIVIITQVLLGVYY